MQKIFLIARSEYLRRVRTKTFILTTLLAPVLMFAVIALPVALAVFTEDDSARRIALVDETGRLAEPLIEALPSAYTIEVVDEPVDSLRAQVLDGRLDGFFVLPEGLMDGTSGATYYGRGGGGLSQQMALQGALRDAVRRVEEKTLARGDITASAVFKFFPVQSEGDQLLVYAPGGEEVQERFVFGRQQEGDGLSLVDYVAAKESGRMDYLAMFVTSVGPGVRALAEEWKERGDYLDSHIVQSLALECAEAFAELLHQQIRKAWGIPDPPGIAMEELYKAHYHGRRYSFGYPACPRLEDQEQLFRLLDVESQIGVELTEGHMMDPESSVSALVFHHPDAKYFNLSERDIELLERRLSRSG